MILLYILLVFFASWSNQKAAPPRCAQKLEDSDDDRLDGDESLRPGTPKLPSRRAGGAVGVLGCGAGLKDLVW